MHKRRLTKKIQNFFSRETEINLSLKRDENELNIEIYELDDNEIILICSTAISIFLNCYEIQDLRF